MRFIRLIALFLTVWTPVWAATAQPVTFEGATVTIVHDGSATAYDPHKQLGREEIAETRGICCVQAPANWHGVAEGFAFKGDIDQHINHESGRFVVNPRTGAFLSSTTLEDPKYPVTDPRRYVDSDITPMVSLSTDEIAACGCKPGDRVLIRDAARALSVWAVYGNNAGDQVDGAAFIGISIGAANALHIPINPLTGKPTKTGYTLTMIVYPGSGYGLHFPHGAVPPVK